MDLPSDRALTDAELAIGIAEAILNDKLNPGRGELPFQPGEFLARLGHRQTPQGFSQENPRSELDFRIAAYCWRLVGLGYFVPKVVGDWGVFHLTPRGKEFLEGFDPATVTAGGLDAKLASIGFAASDLPRLYARLAQDCFLAGHHESAVVMLGSGAEALIQDVAETLETTFLAPVGPLKRRSARSTARQTLSWTSEAVTTHRRQLETLLKSKGVDASWIEPLSNLLQGTGQAIRMTRNDLGHPTGITATQEDALPLLALYPRFAQVCLQALSALK